MKNIRTIFSATVLLLCVVFVCGLVYPVIVTGIVQVVFPHQANGSLIMQEDKVVGSELLGQSFTTPEYFWGRPSATLPPYNAAASAASNFSPANIRQIAAVEARIKALKDLDKENTAHIPIDLVTASASGLDPNISVAAAEYQIMRVATSRKITEQKVRELVNQHTYTDFMGYGSDRVNVLQLNLSLDRLRLEEDKK